MWIISEHTGLLAPIFNAYPNSDTHPVSIRARCRDHLERLIRTTDIEGEIINTPVADYPIRLCTTREGWLDALAALGELAADCKNTKAAIQSAFGADSPMLRFAYRVHDAARQLETRPRP